jgi:hypothetical protein
MMEKLTQPGEGGDASPPPFTISTIAYKEGRYAPPISTLPLYVLCEFSHGHYGYVNLDDVT